MKDSSLPKKSILKGSIPQTSLLQENNKKRKKEGGTV
jgi:hypothetical protein